MACSNPRSCQSVFPPPPAKKFKPSEELVQQTTMECLPAEMILEILKNLPFEDWKNTRFVSRKFDSVITNNAKNTQRTPVVMRLRGSTEGILIEHNLKGGRRVESEKAMDFDFNMWSFVDISGIELVDFKESEEALICLEAVCQYMEAFRQTSVRSLSFVSVMLTNKFTSVLEDLFSKTMGTCKDLLFRDCVIPTAISNEMVQDSVFDHYRWLDSPQCKANDAVIRKFAKDLPASEGKTSFVAELNAVTVESVCDFIEAWILDSSLSFFNFSLQGCDDVWKTKFQLICEDRKLNHYCFEFASKVRPSAHIKVIFCEDYETCRLWPIFDVPARTAGGVYCNARYYRDF